MKNALIILGFALYGGRILQAIFRGDLDTWGALDYCLDWTSLLMLGLWRVDPRAVALVEQLHRAGLTSQKPELRP